MAAPPAATILPESPEIAMALRDWFRKRPTPLQAALERALAPGADLQRELDPLRGYRLKSGDDAQALIEALGQFLDRSDEPAQRARHALIALFQDVEDDECEAFEVLQADGTPLLIRLVEETLADLARFGQDETLFALKILVIHATEEGTDAVIQAARRPLDPESYMWSVILKEYRADHPQAQRLFAA